MCWSTYNFLLIKTYFRGFGLSLEVSDFKDARAHYYSYRNNKKRLR